MKKVNLHNCELSELHFDYRDKYLILMDNIHQSNLAQEHIRNESFFTAMIEDGECVTTINGIDYSLKKGDLLVCTPGNVIEKGMMSLDFRCCIFIIFQENIGEILKGSNLSLTHLLVSNEVGTINLSEDEQTSIRGFYRLISSLNNAPDDMIKDYAIRSLQHALFYILAGLFVHRGYTHKTDRGTAAESTFRKFIHLLKEHPEGRSVQYYADKLNITPKYFNTICKQVSGKTASCIINEELVNTAKIMLNDHDLSIKQISSILGFANQSHFGSFIRRETGLSPLAIRNKRFI